MAVARTFLTLVAAFFLVTSMVLAAPTGGGVDVGASVRYTEGIAGNNTIIAGNITAVNVSGNTITTRWAGFYGEVSGGILLGDSTDNVFFQWSVTDPTGSWVYAANGTVSDWSSSNIIALNSSFLPSYLLQDSGDNFTNTYNWSGSFNSSSLDVANCPYTYTWQNGTQGAAFATYGLQTADNSTLIWAGAVGSNLESFDNTSTTDYQILAPAVTGGQQYFFYLEFK